MKLAIASIFFLMGSGPFVFANWGDFTSVWDQTSSLEHSVQGTVKTIAIDEAADRFLIKIEKPQGGVEVLHLCHGGIQSARNQNVYKSEKLITLRIAMSTGKPVALDFTSNYDRCIQNVSLVSKVSNNL